MTTKTIEISDLTLKDLAKFVKSEPVIVMDKKDPVYAVIRAQIKQPKLK